MLFLFVIFEEFKNHQVFSDLDFEKYNAETVPADEEKSVALNLKTDAIVRLQIPFVCSDGVSESDFSEVFSVKGKMSLCSKKINNRGNGNFILAFYFSEPVHIESVKLSCNKTITYLLDGEFFQNEQYGFSNKIKVLFWICSAFLIFGAYFVFKIISKYIKNFALKYFLTVILLGIGCICIWPAFNVPDEKVHFNSVNYFVSELQGKNPDWGNIIMRICDNQIYPEKIRNEPIYPFAKDLGYIDNFIGYYSNAFSKIFKSPKETEYINFYGQVVSKERIIYFIPHIIGILLCRALNANQFILYYFTCFIALLWNSSIITISFAKTKCNNILLYFLGLNLGLIQQMCHFTYDGTIYALAFAFVLFVFSFYKKRKISDLIASVVCLVLLFPAKGQIYMPLCLFYLLLIEKQIKSLLKNKRNIYIFVTASIVVLLVIYISYIVKNPGLYNFDNTQMGFIRTRTYALLHPFSTILRFFYTFAIKFREFFGGLVGLLLGVRKWYVSFFCVVCYFVLLYYALADKTNSGISKSQKLVCVIVSLLVSLSIFAGMLVTYASTIYIYVGGIQGRYFIPILPLILLSFNSDKLRAVCGNVNQNFDNSYSLQLAIPLYSIVIYLELVSTLLLYF